MGMRLLSIAVLTLGCLSGCQEEDPYTSRDGICLAGRTFVQAKDALVSPGAAKYGECSTSTITPLGNNRWTISSYVDDKVFDADVRKTWTCTMRFDPAAKKWSAEDTQIVDPTPPQEPAKVEVN